MPHVLDMFEPQDHPNDMDERGIPAAPVRQRRLDARLPDGREGGPVVRRRDGAFKEIQGLATPVPGRISGTAKSGYLLSPSINDSFTIANRVLKGNGDVYRLDAAMTEGGKSYPAGTLYVTANAASTPIVQRGVQELGVNVDATSAAPAGTRLAAMRIALWDTPTGSMPSGWTRFLLERFEFPFTVVCGAGFDDSALRSKFDVIILPSGAALRPGGGGRGGGGGGGGEAASRRTGRQAVRSRSAKPVRGHGRHRNRGDGRSKCQEVRRGWRRRDCRGVGGGIDRRVAAAAGVGLPGGAPAGTTRIVR